MVYPGAMHTRFEHSLGVMHLVTLMFNAITQKESNIELLKRELSYRESGLERDRQLIRLTALLHDVGHAPFSHASEEIMPKDNETNEPLKHEHYTTAIIKGPLKDVIENHQLNRSNFRITAEEVAALIEGNAQILGQEKLFWRILISSQLDADRCDYLLRDSHHIGVKYGIYDHFRLLYTLTLGIDPEINAVVLGVDDGGWHVAESILFARYQMFSQVYFHKTRRAYDYHLKEAMKQVLLPNGTLPHLTEIDEFLNLDDTRIWNLIKEKNDVPDCKAILDRNHIRKIYQTPETPTMEDETKIERKINKLNSEGIWNYEDKSETQWYKINKTEDERPEIIIIDDNDKKARPLSEYSPIVISEIKRIRLYVKPEDKNNAKRVINE